MTNDSHKARLAALVQELSVIHEKVTLASGRESDFYVDMRRSTLHHEAAPLIGHVMLDLLEESGFAVGEEYVAVGGLTMGADPVATAMLHAAGGRAHAARGRRERRRRRGDRGPRDGREGAH